MFLSNSQYTSLDNILKEFEVALRSYVCNAVLNKYRNVTEFKYTMIQIKDKLDASSIGTQPILMQKYFSKASNWTKDKTINELYNAINFSNNCFHKREIYEDNNVLFVSEVIDLISLLYNPTFIALSSRFGGNEEFEDFLILYRKLRNSTSHPASKRISISEAQQIIQFVHGCISVIPQEFFWFISAHGIEQKIKGFLSSGFLNNKEERVLHNIEEISIKHDYLLLRETEFKTLNDYLINNRRKAGCVVLHGFGGVGKTALAAEFCFNILHQATNGDSRYEFIVWASSKIEELNYDRSGYIKIKNIRPQYYSFQQFLAIIKKVLQVDVMASLEEVIQVLDEYQTGLIVIDNYETIKSEDKHQFEEFINNCPKIQFIITSREYDDIADKDIQINGFLEDKGHEFVKNYCEMNGYSHNFDIHEVSQFITESCGNTLIITLMLDRIFEGIMDIKITIDNLMQVTNREVEVIAQFMYKNMFDTIIKELEEKYPDIREILNVLLLYKEPIDFHSLRELTEFNPKELEEILAKFIRKYIIDRINGCYQLNEMAIKFVSLKVLPDNTAIKKLIDKIDTYRDNIDTALRKLTTDSDKYAKLLPIMNDWKPISSSETIAIAQAYQMFGEVKKMAGKTKVEKVIKNTEEEFSKYLGRSNHPYIKFQKARTLKQLLDRVDKSSEIGRYLINEIHQCYENAYIDIYTRYVYIIPTQSYCAFLMLYGIFLLVDKKNNKEAIKILEDSISNFESNNILDINTANTYYYLCLAQSNYYLEGMEAEYLSMARENLGSARKMLNSMKYRNDTVKFKLKDLRFLNYFINVELKRGVEESIDQFDKLPPFLLPFYEKIVGVS